MLVYVNTFIHVCTHMCAVCVCKCVCVHAHACVCVCACVVIMYLVQKHSLNFEMLLSLLQRGDAK